MLTIIDMRMGNLTSVCNAIEHLKFPWQITRSAQQVAQATALILPGVGTFGQGMNALHEGGLVSALREAVLQRSVPLLGICVGMQLLAQSGEEFGLHEGLGFIDGHVAPLPAEHGLVPHMGWQNVRPRSGQEDIFLMQENNNFYFAHSYHFQCHNPEDQVAVTAWGTQSITAVIRRKNILGVQFHPEKSQDAGLSFLHAALQHMLGQE